MFGQEPVVRGERGRSAVAEMSSSCRLSSWSWIAAQPPRLRSEHRPELLSTAGPRRAPDAWGEKVLSKTLMRGAMACLVRA